MAKITIPATLYRSATFEKESLNQEERTVSLSVSSDKPYRRFFGNEILDHSPQSIRMNRLLTAGALLFNHERNMHLGRIVEATPVYGQLRVKAQFGNSALAKEKFQDVQDG